MAKKKSPAKKYTGFGKLSGSLQKKGYSKASAGAIAASIGRKKYGAKKFNTAAGKGKKLRGAKAKKSPAPFLGGLLRKGKKALGRALMRKKGGKKRGGILGKLGKFMSKGGVRGAIGRKVGGKVGKFISGGGARGAVGRGIAGLFSRKGKGRKGKAGFTKGGAADVAQARVAQAPRKKRGTGLFGGGRRRRRRGGAKPRGGAAMIANLYNAGQTGGKVGQGMGRSKRMGGMFSGARPQPNPTMGRAGTGISGTGAGQSRLGGGSATGAAIPPMGGGQIGGQTAQVRPQGAMFNPAQAGAAMGQMHRPPLMRKRPKKYKYPK